MSDFSIEYILNRAGEKYDGTNGSLGVRQQQQQQQQHLEQQHDQLQQLQGNQQATFMDQIPVLDWLQYTRYHPPKLQRTLRQGPAKRTPGRLPRIPFTPTQLQALESAYKASNYLSAEDANKLADSLDLTNTRVKIWFQNRRARERRDRREKDESYDSTLSSNASSPEPDDVIDIV
ncbi:homeobox protein Hox-B1a [Stomoxys calcitrans]|uniref:homeobox protein Hox-B1a n=1 Tax=Stomoxys calcitrans TaxID=35570 RepID=UPI0027E28285|nr:homeobox protein Hox-B1a [Stomoxys calcitrans]